MVSTLLKFFKGNKPASRHKIININSLTKTLGKFLIKGIKTTSGKNNFGIITNFHKGGGVKNSLRIIDFYGKYIVSSIVLSIEYDSKRTGFLALVCNNFGFLSYRLASEKLNKGQLIGFGNFLNFFENEGYISTVYFINLGFRIFNVEFYIGSGGKLARAAGTFCKLIKKLLHFAIILCPSGILKIINLNIFCTLGRVSNVNKQLSCLGLAGTNRRLNKRPIVRGVAMNSVDHPQGGSIAGKNSKSPWGKLSKLGFKSKKKLFKNENFRI